MLILIDSVSQKHILKSDLISRAEAGTMRGWMRVRRASSGVFPISTMLVGGEKTLCLKTELGWFPMQDLHVDNDELSFFFNWQYFPEATIADLSILLRAKKLLDDPTSWNQADDRNCEEDTENRKRSLFCALKEASIKIRGAYNHRSGAMQTVRESIKLRHPRKRFKHGIKDFNNWEKTNHDDVLEVLSMSIQRMKTRLNDYDR